MSDDDVIFVKGRTPEELVSPRFWDMRKFIVDFGQARVNGRMAVEKGDMVMVTNGRPEMDGPWIIMGSVNDEGHYVLGNGAGQMMYVPTWDFPLYAVVISKISESLG